MTSLVAADMEALLDQLDPDRDYGDRSLDDVKREVRAGALLIKPSGTRHPLLSDASTGKRVTGSGGPPGGHIDAREWGRDWFFEFAVEELPGVAAAMVAAAKGFDITGRPLKNGPDPRAQKLFIETFLGVPQRQSVSMPAEAFKDLLVQLQAPVQQEVVYEVK